MKRSTRSRIRSTCWPAATRATSSTTTNTQKKSPPERSPRTERFGRDGPRGPRLSTPKSLARSLEGVLSTFCGRPVAGDRALIMAIVNRTPDSFYDRGATFTDEAAKTAAHRVIEAGADVVAVGGVKAGPGSS